MPLEFTLISEAASDSDLEDPEMIESYLKMTDNIKTGDTSKSIEKSKEK